jgi:hypothetical protein
MWRSERNWRWTGWLGSTWLGKPKLTKGFKANERIRRRRRSLCVLCLRFKPFLRGVAYHHHRHLLCRVFTTVCLKEAILLGYVANVTAIVSLQFMVHVVLTLFPVINVLYFYISTFQSVWLFSVLPWFRAFHVGCSGIFCIILRWFQLPLLLLVLVLFLHFTFAVFLL